MSNYKQLALYIFRRTYRGHYSLILFSILALSISKTFLVSSLFIYRNTINEIFLKKNVDAEFFPFLMILYGGLYIIGVIINEIRDFFYSSIAQKKMWDIGSQTFKHIHSIGLKDLQSYNLSFLNSIVDKGLEGLEFLSRCFLYYVLPILIDIICMSLVFYILFGAKCFFIVFVVIILYAIISALLVEKNTNTRIEQVKSKNMASRILSENILNHETVRYFNTDQMERNKYGTHLKKYSTYAIKSLRHTSILNTVQAVILTIGFVSINIFIGHKVIDGKMIVGDIFLGNMVLFQLYSPLNSFGLMYREISKSIDYVAEYIKFMNITKEDNTTCAGESIKNIVGHIEFSNVSFGYSPSSELALANVNLQINPEKLTAIVGASGSGKSTLVRLLFRFYKPTGGSIFIDSRSINSLPLSEYRNLFSIVPQNPVILNDSIFNNICYGNKVSMREVEKAIRLADLDELINSLKEKLYTVIGEGGVRLSGGEKQKIAIARVLLSKKPILILDEATSSLDVISEKKIINNITRFVRNKTCIVIAHRLSTIKNAHRIYVLNKGRVIEVGDHDSLMNIEGKYCDYWNDRESKAQNNQQSHQTL